MLRLVRLCVFGQLATARPRVSQHILKPDAEFVELKNATQVFESISALGEVTASQIEEDEPLKAKLLRGARQSEKKRQETKKTVGSTIESKRYLSEPIVSIRLVKVSGGVCKQARR